MIAIGPTDIRPRFARDEFDFYVMGCKLAANDYVAIIHSVAPLTGEL